MPRGIRQIGIKHVGFLKQLFVLIFHTVRVDARCSKYDFWNPGKILNGTRSGIFLVVKKKDRKNISIEKKKKFSSKNIFVPVCKIPCLKILHVLSLFVRFPLENEPNLILGLIWSRLLLFFRSADFSRKFRNFEEL